MNDGAGFPPGALRNDALEPLRYSAIAAGLLASLLMLVVGEIALILGLAIIEGVAEVYHKVPVKNLAILDTLEFGLFSAGVVGIAATAGGAVSAWLSGYREESHALWIGILCFWPAWGLIFFLAEDIERATMSPWVVVLGLTLLVPCACLGGYWRIMMKELR